MKLMFFGAPGWRYVIRFIVLACVVGQALAAPVEVAIGISPVTSSAAVFIAAEKGYFEQVGIKPLLQPFKGSAPQMVPLLATGQLMVGGGNVTAGLYNAITQDIPIKLVADKGIVTPGHGYLALIVRKQHVDSGRFKTFADLKGMTLAVTARGVSQEIATEYYLKTAGLTLKDISLSTLAYADMNIALANGALDAAVQIEPYVASAVESGLAVRVAGSDEVYPNQQSAVMMYSPVFIEKYPQLAKDFMVAYVRGQRDYNDAFEKNIGRDEIIRILAKHTAMKDPAIYAKVAPVGLHPDGVLNIESLRSDAKWFVEHGYLKGEPDMDKIVDTRFVQYAVEKLGPYK